MPYIGRSTEAFGVRSRFTFLASADDTSVSGNDVNGLPLSFTDGAYVDVFLNGVRLKHNTDYVTTTANTISSLSALAANDEIEVVVFDVFSLADMVSSANGGNFFNQVNFKTDSAVVAFGADNDVTLTHVADTGLKLKNTSTSGNSGIGAVLTLQTGDTDIAVNNILGSIQFQAPDEGTGTDAILVAGKMEVFSEGDFSSSNNATSMRFLTGRSAAAGTDGGSMILGSTGNLTIKDLRTTDGSSARITLQSGDTDIAQDDILGQLEFQAPDEATGTDAILLAAAIGAVSEGDFSSSSNATKLSFKTGASEAATEKMSLSSAGLLTVSGRIITDDTTEATSTTDGSLQTDGGLSVAKDIVAGDDVKLLSDSAVLSFGADSDITVTHVADTGLTLKNSATGDDNPFVLTLQTGETDIAQDDVLGQIDFQAPDEGTGTDAILKSASIQAVSEGDFSSSFNRTSLVLNTARSAAVGSAGDGGKLTLKSNGSMLLKDMRTDANAPSFILQTGSTNVAQDDVLGAIEFQAPDEGTGTDAILVAAGISAVSEGDFSSSSNATSLVFKTGSSETAAEKMRINSAGKVLVGTTASRSMFTVSPNFFIEGTGFDDSSMGIVTNRNDGNGGFLFLGKSKGTSLGSSTVVSSGNDLGAIAFAAADGSDMESIAAMIVGGISDDVSPGANDVPGTLKFATASDSGTSATHRMQIDQLGRIRVGSDGELKHRLVSQQTTGVGTSAATIATVGTFSTFGGHYFITGRNADSSASRFCDQLTAGLNGSINVFAIDQITS